MTYKVTLTKDAQEEADIVYSSYPKSQRRKLFNWITDELVNHPQTGSGKPEKLKGEINKWSRRLNKKDRVIYYIEGDIVEVEIIQCLGHYKDT